MFQESAEDRFIEVHFNEYFYSQESRFKEGDKKDKGNKCQSIGNIENGRYCCSTFKNICT